MGAKMDYHVAQDTRDAYMQNAWFKATGEAGIPTCLLVDKDGRITWLGHPKELDGVLKQALSGTLDVQASAAKVERNRARQASFLEAWKAFIPVEPELKRLVAARDWDGVIALADRNEAAHPNMEFLPKLFLADRVKALANAHPEQVKPFLDKAIKDKDGVSSYEEAVNPLMQIRELGKGWSELGLTYLNKVVPRDPAHEKELSAQAFGFMLCLDDTKAGFLFGINKADETVLRDMLGLILELQHPSKPWLEEVVKGMEPWLKTPDGGLFYQGLAKAYFGLGRIQEAVKAQEAWIALLKEKGATPSYLDQAAVELASYQAANTGK